MYKRVILNIKRKQNNFFLEFLKYWPSFRAFNKLVIKAKMHANTYFFEFLNFLKKNLRKITEFLKIFFFAVLAGSSKPNRVSGQS